MEKVEISPEKEYESLRAEILKRIEIQFTVLNLKLTIVSVFLGLGINNNILALLAPPITCLLAIIYKKNSLGIYQISNYLIEKYEGESSNIGWESYNLSISNKRGYKKNIFLLGIGPLGIFILTTTIAMFIGLSKFSWKPIEVFLLVIDTISLILIVYVFTKFSSAKMKKKLK